MNSLSPELDLIQFVLYIFLGTRKTEQTLNDRNIPFLRSSDELNIQNIALE